MMCQLGPYALDAVHQGEALALLRAVPDASVDMVLTDPPYSSGGFTRSDRNDAPEAKYARSNETFRQWTGFTGDNRDGRSWAYWCTLWLSECLRATRPSGFIVVFSDWRQVPLATDAIQAGGWVWRGIAPWDKTEGARPQSGRLRNQCEYAVWGTNGPAPNEGDAHPGCFRYSVRPDDKFHLTGKPTPLMRDLVKLVRPGGLILDPFAGSGTTVVAALLEGRRAVGFEVDPEHARVANGRVAAARGSVDVRSHLEGQVALFEAPKA